MIGAQVERADVVAVDQDAPALELVEAPDQLADARLARAGVPDQRQRLARADVQREVLQYGLLLVVAEVDVIELDLAADARQPLLSVCTTFGSASISPKTRSPAARPSWNWLQNEAMLVSGNQNSAKP